MKNLHHNPDEDNFASASVLSCKRHIFTAPNLPSSVEYIQYCTSRIRRSTPTEGELQQSRISRIEAATMTLRITLNSTEFEQARRRFSFWYSRDSSGTKINKTLLRRYMGRRVHRSPTFTHECVSLATTLLVVKMALQLGDLYNG